MKLVLIITSLMVTTVARAETCLDLFSTVPFTDGRAESFETSQRGETHRGGYAYMTGKVAGTLRDSSLAYRTELVGFVNYSVVGNTLSLGRSVHKGEFDGQGVYSTLLASIIIRYDNVTEIMTSMSGLNYLRFKADLESTQGDMAAAVALNPLGKELARLGFKEVVWAQELNNPVQSFLRLRVRRSSESIPSSQGH